VVSGVRRINKVTLRRAWRARRGGEMYMANCPGSISSMVVLCSVISQFARCGVRCQLASSNVFDVVTRSVDCNGCCGCTR